MDKKPKTTKDGKYFEAVGRRKTAIARVRISKGNGKVTVNDKDIAEYFPTEKLRNTVTMPFEKLGETGWSATLKVLGGGVKAQAEAARHGVSRALIKVDPEFKKQLKPFGFLTRDPRMVERKKYGLKKARRAPQWNKR